MGKARAHSGVGPAGLGHGGVVGSWVYCPRVNLLNVLSAPSSHGSFSFVSRQLPFSPDRSTCPQTQPIAISPEQTHSLPISIQALCTDHMPDTEPRTQLRPGAAIQQPQHGCCPDSPRLWVRNEGVRETRQPAQSHSSRSGGLRLS